MIIEKHWRDITPRDVCDEFWKDVLSYDCYEDAPTVSQYGKHYVVQVYRSGVFLAGILEREVDTLQAVEILHRIHNMLKVGWSLGLVFGVALLLVAFVVDDTLQQACEYGCLCVRVCGCACARRHHHRSQFFIHRPATSTKYTCCLLLRACVHACMHRLSRRTWAPW